MRLVIGRSPVLGAFYALIDVVANQVIGLLWRSPLDQDGCVCFPGSDNLAGGGGHTCEQTDLFIRLLLEKKAEKRKGWKQTFELLSLDRSSRLRRLAAAVHIGRQNSEPVLFALCQIKHGVAGRSDGDLSVDTLPRSTLRQALRTRGDKGQLLELFSI